MEKRILPIMFMALSALVASAKAPSDPVLMSVNGVDVPLSEFEYLYHKNNAQQANPQPLDEYVDMFVTYKLKVADAKAAGIDTTKAFIKEFEGYRNELAQPYLRDLSVENALVDEAYARMLRNVDVDHIMLPLSDDGKALADSLRREIVSGADFYTIAHKYSVDPSCRYNGGHIGWIGANVYPYDFEEMAYNTPVGEVSPVFATAYGYHIVRVNAMRDNPGEVLVSHILKRFAQDRTEESDAAAMHSIDSIYAVVTSPGVDFAAVAKAESEDPGSARNGGQLPWFGVGQMLQELDGVAFALADGEVSKPFKSRFGYHIFKRIDSRGVAPLEDVRASILEAINK
ncbi:MAG: peptidyl-prolyl cis-trans isomerase, partial [Muribaculaceae bacterium]|nr:peptidyl-prolyl cis-trans isomerase [Muribaculaceae bacterium]